MKNFDVITVVVSFVILLIVRVFLPAGFLKDSWGNIWGVVVASFFFFYFNNIKDKKDCLKITLSACVGFIIYEFLQIFIPWNVFDIQDVYGTLIGVLLMVVLIEIRRLLS